MVALLLPITQRFTFLVLLIVALLTEVSFGQTDPDNSSAAPPSSYPSIFMAWSEDLDYGHPSLAGMARHDLLILGPQQMGLEINQVPVASTIARALDKRRELKRINAKIIILAEVRYYDAWDGYLPSESPLWRRDKAGNRMPSGGAVYGANHVYLLDFSNPTLQDSVAAQCKAYLESGVFDGCMFDWWNSAYSDAIGSEGTDRLAIIKKVRVAVGEKPLLVANVNGSLPKLTAAYLNGAYMEGFGSSNFSNWRQAVENLAWLNVHLRAPAFTALEGWYNCGNCVGDPETIQQQGRDEFSLMREVTTLSLTNSNGYVLFGDPDVLSTPDHLHNWYPFWNKTLGRPTGLPGVRSSDGAYRRAFDNGCVIFNPPGNQPVQIIFRRPHRSVRSGTLALSYTVDGGDGDIFTLERGDDEFDGEKSCSGPDIGR